MTSPSVAAPHSPPNPRRRIEFLSDAWRFVHTCPHAQVLTGFSKTLDRQVLIPLVCKQWKCPYCSQQKIKQLASKNRDAKPNRLLTLTVRPSLYEDPRHAFDETRRKVPELIRRLRTRFGEIEYLRVTEVTKKGWPHYHLLIRSKYLPQPVVKAVWCEMTNAEIVDLRRVKKSFEAYTYLVKYLSKLHSIEWTERHVSYSRGYFPPSEPPPRQDLELEHPETVEATPAAFLLECYPDCELERISPTLYAIHTS